jgi:hypothetical protein
LPLKLGLFVLFNGIFVSDLQLKSGVYILLVLYFASAATPAVSIFNYCLNYTYYSQVICINKNKPKSDCNGTCALKKEIGKLSQENSAVPISKDNCKKITLYDFIPTVECPVYLLQNKTVYIFFTKSIYSFLLIHSFFHPPEN